jgi:hypothetical protein
MYLGHLVEPGASVAVQYAAVVFPTVLLAIAVCYLAVALLRVVASRNRHNHPAGGNAGSALQFAIERQWPGVPQPARSVQAPAQQSPSYENA